MTMEETMMIPTALANKHFIWWTAWLNNNDSDSENEESINYDKEDDSNSEDEGSINNGESFVDEDMVTNLLIMQLIKELPHGQQRDGDEWAKSEWQLQVTIEEPIGEQTIKNFVQIIENNLLNNCGTTLKYILIAGDMFSPSAESGLTGKTSTPSTTHAVREDIVSISDFILDNCKDIYLCTNIIFVNVIPSITIVLWHIYFISTETVGNIWSNTLLKYCKGAFAH